MVFIIEKNKGAPLGGAWRGLYFLWPKATFFTVRHFAFHYVWLFGTKSDVMVATGRYELVHISADATITSRLPKAVHT